MNRTRARTRTIGLAALFLGTFSLQCSDQPVPLGTDAAGFGRIQGTVTAGLEPPGPVHLLIVSAGTRATDGLRLEFDSDSLGGFSQMLPAGEYRLGVYSPDLETYFWYRRDGWTRAEEFGETLMASDTVNDLDLRLGTLELNLRLPQGYDSSLYVSCRLRRQSTGLVLRLFSNSFDADRPFNFRLIPPDTYTAQFRVNGEPLWMHATFDSTQATLLTVPPGERLAAGDTIPPAGTVQGLFVSSWQPIGSSRISAALPGDAILEDTGRLNEDGSFGFPLLGSGPFRVGIWLAPNYEPRWLGGGTLASATAYTMVPGQTVDVGTIRDSAIFCRILRPPDWDPESAWMRIRLKPYGRVLYRSLSDSVLIPNLAPGIYRLNFSPLHWDAPWMPQWYDGVESEDAATPVTITSEGELKVLDVHLAEGARISGRILEAGGEPARLVSVEALGIAPGSFGSSTETDEGGHYRIVGLPSGAYKVAAAWLDVLTWYPGTADEDSAAVVQVQAPEETTGIDFRLR